MMMTAYQLVFGTKKEPEVLEHQSMSRHVPPPATLNRFETYFGITLSVRRKG